MSIVLSPDVVKQIEELVKSGRFTTADTVFRAGLQLLTDWQEALEERREEIERLVVEGVRALEEGRYTDYDDEGLKALFEEIKAEGRRSLVLPADEPITCVWPATSVITFDVKPLVTPRSSLPTAFGSRAK